LILSTVVRITAINNLYIDTHDCAVFGNEYC